MTDIHTCWQRFKLGLSLFVVGVVLLFTLSTYHPLLNYLSIAVLIIGFAIAMLGYSGIFLQRFSSFKNIKKPPKF
jgi:uncharacterized membrane protein YidH (DUF202 family)